MSSVRMSTLARLTRAWWKLWRTWALAALDDSAMRCCVAGRVSLRLKTMSGRWTSLTALSTASRLSRWCILNVSQSSQPATRFSASLRVVGVVLGCVRSARLSSRMRWASFRPLCLLWLWLWSLLMRHFPLTFTEWRRRFAARFRHGRRRDTEISACLHDIQGVADAVPLATVSKCCKSRFVLRVLDGFGCGQVAATVWSCALGATRVVGGREVAAGRMPRGDSRGREQSPPRAGRLRWGRR